MNETCAKCNAPLPLDSAANLFPDRRRTCLGCGEPREEPLVRMWRARPECGGTWCYDEKLSALAETIDDCAYPGSKYVIECVELSRAEADAMGDFDGW